MDTALNGFSDIQLGPEVLRELYKGHLVSDNEAAAGIPKPPPEPIRYLGKNKAQIVILVKYNDTPFLPDEQLEFLTRMLDACKKNLGDVAIANYGAQGMEYEQIKKEFSPKQLILFGVDPAEIDLPVNFPLFKLQAFDGCTLLKSHALHDLNHDGPESKNLKGQLWNCLKQLFGL